ncbi:MAG: O-antigen polymerase, partial [Bacteroidota bacterium]
YAMLTEPYMYMVMNLENFARSVSLSDHHTYGYFTFDFITAITGIKYWVLDYFNLERTPYINSSYNTYTAFWWFYSDFGVIGLAIIPMLLGLVIGLLYYRMRTRPTLKNVTAYGVMVFVIVISYFNFPFAFLWFGYCLIVLYLILRYTVRPEQCRETPIVAQNLT